MTSSSSTESPFERRRSRQREDARQAILSAADALLAEDGLERFSMRRLAGRCGYTAPTIYHHFGDKSGLLDALIDERFRRLLQRLRRNRNGGEPLAMLRAMAEAFIRFSLKNPAHFQLIASRDFDGSEPLPSLEEVRELFVGPLEEFAERGELHAAGPEEAAQSIWALLHGLVSLQISRPDIDWSKSLVRTSLDGLFRGLVIQHTDIEPRRTAPTARRRKGS